MNRSKWDADHSDEVFSAKLAEEVGEVARLQVRLAMNPNTHAPAARLIRERMNEELGHVEWIAYCWRRKLVRENGGVER